VSDGHSLLETISDSMAPVHPDGHKFVAIGAIAALLFFLLWPPLGWLLTVVTAWVVYFFRDPERVTPMREGLIVAPADGRVSAIEKIKPPAELGLGDEMRTRVSIFLSVFDVHIQRAPIAGRVVRSVYIPGAFFNAALDKASDENERRATVIESPSGVGIGVVQIAGLVARRILSFISEGDGVGAGQRIGLIRFGSRVDTYLPPEQEPIVSVGQRAVAGETVLADLSSDEPERDFRAG
jgi:phosphatidylserine decarboxylase